MKDRSAKAILRCAIYTRVSTDQGLEQDFNSLDAQREASEAYIKSSGARRLAADPGSLQRRRLFRRVDGPTGSTEASGGC